MVVQPCELPQPIKPDFAVCAFDPCAVCAFDPCAVCAFDQASYTFSS